MSRQIKRTRSTIHSKTCYSYSRIPPPPPSLSLSIFLFVPNFFESPNRFLPSFSPTDVDKKEDSFKDQIRHYIKMDPGNTVLEWGEELFQDYQSSENEEEFEEKVILAANSLVSTKEKRGGEMPVNTLHASFFQRFNQLLLIQPTTNAKCSLNRRDNNSSNDTRRCWWYTIFIDGKTNPVVKVDSWT